MTSTQPQQSILTEEQKDNIKTLWRHLQSLKLYVSHNDQQIPLFVPHNEQHAAYFKYALNANSLGMYISIEKNPDFVVATDLLKYDSFGRTILHIAAISGDIEIRQLVYKLNKQFINAGSTDVRLWNVKDNFGMTASDLFKFCVGIGINKLVQQRLREQRMQSTITKQRKMSKLAVKFTTKKGETDAQTNRLTKVYNIEIPICAHEQLSDLHVAVIERDVEALKKALVDAEQTCRKEIKCIVKQKGKSIDSMSKETVKDIVTHASKIYGPDVVDEYGRTALHVATIYGAKDACDVLKASEYVFGDMIEDDFGLLPSDYCYVAKDAQTKISSFKDQE